MARSRQRRSRHSDTGDISSPDTVRSSRRRRPPSPSSTYSGDTEYTIPERPRIVTRTTYTIRREPAGSADTPSLAPEIEIRDVSPESSVAPTEHEFGFAERVSQPSAPHPATFQTFAPSPQHSSDYTFPVPGVFINVPGTNEAVYVRAEAAFPDKYPPPAPPRLLGPPPPRPAEDDEEESSGNGTERARSMMKRTLGSGSTDVIHTKQGPALERKSRRDSASDRRQPNR